VSYKWYSSDTYVAGSKVFLFGWGSEYKGTPLTNNISVFGFLDISSGELSSTGSCFDKKSESSANLAITPFVTNVASLLSTTLNPLTYTIGTLITDLALIFNTGDSFTDEAS